MGFEPWNLGSKSALPLNWTTVHYPQRSVIFLSRTSCTQQLPTQYRTQNKTAAALYHDVLAPVFYDSCIGAEPMPSHIQSANMINKRMVSLKLNLFILNINSSPFLVMLLLIPSMPLLTNQLFISLLSANDNPTLPESLHESINQQGIDHRPQFDFAGGCCCCCWLCLHSIHCLFLDVMNNVYEFPSFVKEQRQHQRSAAT